ncbi:MAG: N-formylglutamate amidohydrolase [Chloroflexota bacterium]
MLLDDAGLAHELLVMTDHHTDALFAWVVAQGATALVNQWSRLVMDPERFEDAAQGAHGARRPRRCVHTCVGRSECCARAMRGHARLVDELYRPWHRALSTLVDEALAAFDACLVLDCHSFGTVPLPSEADQDPGRPDVCVGTDGWHTPPSLADALGPRSAPRGSWCVGTRRSPARWCPPSITAATLGSAR